MTKLAQLIGREEGFGRAGVLPTVRNNPGDLRHSPHSQHPGGPEHRNDVGTIDSAEDGWADLERQLQLDSKRGLTLQQAIFEWAPEGDGNNHPAQYLADVAAGFGGAVNGNTPLSEVLRISAITSFHIAG